jgi:hypothetical protein
MRCTSRSGGSFSPGVVKRWEEVTAVSGCVAVLSVWGLGDGWVASVLGRFWCGVGGCEERSNVTGGQLVCWGKLSRVCGERVVDGVAVVTG